MARHNELGKRGEMLAAGFLKKSGFNILHQNWRYRHWEVDMIASKEKVLHFIEVKTRKNIDFGYPEEGVTDQKLKNLTYAAEEYLHQYPEWNTIQFDILAILLKSNNTYEFFFVDDIDLTET